MFQPIYITIITNIKKSLGKGSGQIIDSVTDHTVSILKYNLLAGSSYIKLQKELDHPRKGLINISNTDDNECFKWCLVRYLKPADRNPARIIKADKYFAKNLDFKEIQFSVKTRDICKIEKKNSIGTSVFDYGNKVKYPIYVSNKSCKDQCSVDLLFIGEGQRKHYIFMNDFNTFLYHHKLDCGRKSFCSYCLQGFRTAEKFKYHTND